jgi:hypothetical protein
MILKQLDEALTDYAGGAENANAKCFRHPRENLPQRTQRKTEEEATKRHKKHKRVNAKSVNAAFSFVPFVRFRG